MENKLGDGVAIFLTHEKYPENSVVYPVYKNLVKMLLSHSHANAKIKVTGSDKVRFSLFYEENGEETLYLLNTAYDAESTVNVICGDKSEKITLAPTELRTLKL
jgi:hypothetical protein